MSTFRALLFHVYLRKNSLLLVLLTRLKFFTVLKLCCKFKIKTVTPYFCNITYDFSGRELLYRLCEYHQFCHFYLKIFRFFLYSITRDTP